MSPVSDLSALLALPPERRLAPLMERGEALQKVDGQDPALAAALADLVDAGVGDTRERVRLGDVLGALGDPRLRRPADDDYWATVSLDGYTLQVGRFLVTNAEWRAFLDAGGYSDDAAWSDEGRAWRDSGARRWPDYLDNPAFADLLGPNQPAVGVTWYEAIAYATAHGARLLERVERSQIVRGTGKRPYPWGEPFGMGNANTREEVIGRTTAVGLYIHDATPEGITDLAGNAAEWNLDEVGGNRVIHPGSWRQPSMASWAKALALRPPDSRADDLGFRLARG